MRAAIVIFASVILFAAGAAPAADLKLVPRSSPKSAPASATPADVPIQAYGKHDASCVTWTDGCRNCERSADGSTCSNIGIACQPGAIKCTARK